MWCRLLMVVFCFVPIVGCSDSGTKVLDGEVKLDPDVGSDVNDTEKMKELMNASPAAPK